MCMPLSVGGVSHMGKPFPRIAFRVVAEHYYNLLGTTLKITLPHCTFCRDVIEVSEVQHRPDHNQPFGQSYLRLADGRGWVCSIRAMDPGQPCDMCKLKRLQLLYLFSKRRPRGSGDGAAMEGFTGHSVQNNPEDRPMPVWGS